MPYPVGPAATGTGLAGGGLGGNGPGGNGQLGSWGGGLDPGVRQLVADEQKAALWGRRALVAYGLLAVGTLLVFVLYYASAYHPLVHWFREANTASQNGQAAPPLPTIPNAGYLYLFSLPALAAQVLLLIWQFRAAKAAQWLRLPARHRPGWGVGFWFIPIANFFCPYQALRDCLPPQDPNRGRVLRFWLFLIAVELVDVGGEVSSVFSRPAGIVLLVVAALLWLVVVADGLKVIGSIEASHRQITGI